MRLLITGANGQLGNEMRLVLAHEEHITSLFTDVAELDITNAEEVEHTVADFQPDFIINCAAYTAVDKAEDDSVLAQKLNTDAVRNLALAAMRHNARIIHISTDYVFDGNSCIPYTEDMPTCPMSVYGNTKLLGEQALRDTCPNSVIIRTAWLYSPFGNNFVKTMLRLGSERTELKVVFDQIGSPTYAEDLANAILTIVKSNNWVSGIFHFSNEGVCSWYDFTAAILQASNLECAVYPIESKDYPARAHRPAYSVLNKTKIKTTYGVKIPHWHESLLRCLEKLKKRS